MNETMETSVRQPDSTTHDTSRVQQHITDIHEFLATVQDSINSAFPKTSRSKYRAVHVLLLSWVNDDLKVEIEIQRLFRVFEELYGFGVAWWLIPSDDSHNELGDRLRSFTKQYAQEDTLLIIYYGGHGYIDSNRQPIWLW